MKAAPGDYVYGIALQSGVPLQKLLLDNLEALKDFDAPLTGKRLLLCGGKGAAMMTQLQALLHIRAALDATGALASSWTAERGANGGYCDIFAGITCDDGNNVKSIAITSGAQVNGRAGIRLGGVLPSDVLLRALPKLTNITFWQVDLTGTLPPDWGGLAQLEDIRIVGNAITGPLPVKWSGMARLKVLYLQ